MRFYIPLKTAWAKDFTGYSHKTLTGIGFQQEL